MRWLARGLTALPPGDGWLAPAEAARARSLRLAKRRTEYLLRRLVGKQAVAIVAGLPAGGSALARIEIANHPCGAPYPVLDGVPVELPMSLTDRAGWAVCLVGERPGGSDSGVGCDLELVEPRGAAFIRDFLAGPEREYVAAQPAGDARDQAANLIWSAKESALKVLRTGLRLDTRDVEVTVDPPACAVIPPTGSGTPPVCAASPPVGAPGWARLSVRVPGGERLPGWWRRGGVFVCTMVGAAPVPAPVPLDGADPLDTARPVAAVFRDPPADRSAR